MSSEYEQLIPQENGWSKWSWFPRRFKHQCCSCGEIHAVQMRLDRATKKIWMRWKTDNRGKKRD